jgi:hypothetical protein
MTDQQILELFSPLNASFLNTDRQSKSPPLLAHYTSIKVMERILQSNEIWFSNPLFMNDLQEVRFGLNEGTRLFSNAELLKKAAVTDARAALLHHAFSHFFREFDTQDVFDTYVFCLSEHNKTNTDGLLSMWRGYGQHGDGVALVFDAGAVTEVPTSPLIVSQVSYASDGERVSQLEALLHHWAEISERANIPDNKLYVAVHVAFLGY